MYREMVSAEPRYVAHQNLAASMVDGEAVILNLKDGNYYGLNTVGAEVWRWLHEPKTVEELVGLMTAQYEVDTGTARQDVERLLRDLEARHLIQAVS